MATLSFSAESSGAIAPVVHDLGAMTQTARAQLRPENIPAYLKERPQWVCWQYARRKNGELTKPPKTVHGGNASTKDPATWTTFDAALAAFNKQPRFAGIGFCLSPDDGLVGIDIDDDGLKPSPETLTIFERFSGTYIEGTPTRKAGAHIWLLGQTPSAAKAGTKVSVSETLSVECYRSPSSRYLTITGNVINHVDISLQQDALEWLYETYLTRKKPAKPLLEAVAVNNEPAELACLNIPTDTEREPLPAQRVNLPSVSVGTRPVDYARRLELALGNAKIAALYRGDASGYKSRSEAECALIFRLAQFADGNRDILADWMNDSGCTRWNEENNRYRLRTLNAGIDGWVKQGEQCFVDPWDAQIAEGRDIAANLLRNQAANNGGTWLDMGGTNRREPGCDDEVGSGIEAIAPISKLRQIELAQIGATTLKPPEFVINPLIPRGHLTLFGSHGGSGKTTVSLVMAAHVATGISWAGLDIQQGHVLIVSFEDGEDLLLWRLRKIIDEYGLDTETVIQNMTVIDATRTDGIMVEASLGGIRQIVLTESGHELLALIQSGAYDLVIIDNASDAFGGDENQRRQVRRFVRQLADSVSAHNGAILLLAHIDKSAARFGAGKNSYAGSTAWHNSARSRLALMDDQLIQEKLNVGKTLESAIPIAWTEKGVPVPGDSIGALNAQAIADTADDKALLACFAVAAELHTDISTSPTRGNAHQIFTLYSECPQALHEKKRFERAMTRLQRNGKIRKEAYQTHDRKTKERFVLIPTDTERGIAPI